MAGPRSLRDTIAYRYGLKPSGDWEKNLERAIVELAEERRLPRQLVESQLYANANLLRLVAGKLTVEETFFFRFPEQIDSVVNHLAKRITNGGKKAATVWSAGCSSGEEPYSVAMGLYQRLGGLPLGAKILACDINSAAIERAKHGTYGKWSFRGVSEAVQQRYFTPVAGEKHRIHEAFRERVGFEHLAIDELGRRLESESVSAVLFRNVGVYLDQLGLERSFKQFHRVLEPDGLLVLAATDPTPPKTLFVRCSGAKVGYYRPIKRGASAESQQPGITPSRLGAPILEEQGPVPSIRPSGNVEALALGDRGELLEAIEVANRSVARNPNDPSAYMIRGQLLLADGNSLVAVDDLRRVLFLRPGDRLARYWYVVALHAAGQASRLIAQIAELRRQLATMADDGLLEDGTTRAAELRAALDTFEHLYE